MQVSELFSPDQVAVGLVLGDKAEALTRLARLLAHDAGTGPETIFEALSARERLASTGVGSGVAIPHGRVPGVDGVRVAVATCPLGVDFASVDGEPVHILVGILAPQRRPTDHLKVLARVSRILRDESTREALLSARDSDELLGALRAAAAGC